MAKFEIDDAAVRKLAELLDETGLTEIEFSEGDKRLRVAKSVTQNVATTVAAAPVAAAAAAAEPATP